MPQGTLQDTVNLKDGTVALQWPAGLTADGYEDFKDWVELALKRIKRTVAPTPGLRPTNEVIADALRDSLKNNP